MRGQYNTNKVRNYLKQIDLLQEEIYEREANLHRYEARLLAAGLVEDETARQNRTAMQEAITQQARMQDAIIHQISRLDEPAERKCLSCRFIDALTNEETSYVTGYSESYVRLTVRNAYRHFYEANHDAIDDWYEDRYGRA